MSIVYNNYEEIEDKIREDLTLRIENKFGMGMPRYISVYSDWSLPFAYAKKVLKLKRPPRSNFDSIDLKFNGSLRPHQEEVVKEAIKRLSKTGSVIMSCHPGWGKTCAGIFMSIVIKMKTLIIVNKIVLMKQWEESIKKFCPQATVQRLTAKSKKKDCDFYIMNAQNVEKKGIHFWSNIGNVVVDECHMVMAETLSRSLQFVSPRYLIGLSATPYRPDGLDVLLDLYFGGYKIVRKLWCEHIVYKINTGYTPPVERNIQGRLNWGSILDGQARNKERNTLIADIISRHRDRKFLVLVKRIFQGNYLEKILKNRGESVTSLLGKNQEFDKDARVLIGTCQKVGVGFDHPDLNALVLAADVEEYFVQYLGRVFRTKEVKPIIFDLVDINKTLEKHYNTRLKVYKEHGGTVKRYEK